MADRAVAGSAFKYAVTDSASDDRFAAVRQSLANASRDDDSHLDDDACAKLLANHQPRELVEHLLQAASGGGHRIVHRQSLHQLLQLLRKLPDAEQAAALRRLRRLVSRSQYNVHACTAQLRLVELLLRELRPSAAPPAPAALEAQLELLGELGSHRTTTSGIVSKTDADTSIRCATT